MNKFQPISPQDTQTAAPCSSSSGDSAGELKMECDGDVCRVVTGNQDSTAVTGVMLLNY